MQIRALSQGDIDVICRHREQMFREAGRSDDVLATMAPHFRRWLDARLDDGRYYGFLGIELDRVVAGIGLMTIDWPPHPSHPEQSQRGYVLNVYVEPESRGRGVARSLMARAESEFARRGIGFAILHSTDMGRELYARLGWAPTSEHSKLLAPP